MKVPKGKEKYWLRRPGVEPGAKAWDASMLPIHHRRSWSKMRGPGIEPGSTAWKATMLTITPATQHDKDQQLCTHSSWKKTRCRLKEKLAVPGFEPGSSGPQPLMLTTTLYHQQLFLNPAKCMSKICIRGGIRTRDLLLRRQTRYPLRHTDIYLSISKMLSHARTYVSCITCEIKKNLRVKAWWQSLEK